MTSQYGVHALSAGRMHTPTRSGTHIHSHTRKHARTGQYVILIFHNNNGLVNAPQCYVVRTLPVLLYFCLLVVNDEPMYLGTCRSA